MKRILNTLILLAFLSSCSESSENPADCCAMPDEGILNINIHPHFNGEDFVLNQSYTINDTLTLRVEELKMYVQLLSPETFSSPDINLFEGTNTSFSYNLGVETYNEISFNIGLDETTNHSDPSFYEASAPLSSFNNMHWSWAQGYKFLIIEGKFDSDGDNVPDQSFSYHIGNDQYLAKIDLTKDLIIAKDDTLDISVDFKVDELFNGVDIPNNTFTHSTGQFDLVEILVNNIENSFSLEE